MKKVISVLLALTMIFCLTACAGGSEGGSGEDPIKVTFVGIMSGGMCWGVAEEAFMAACDELGWDGQYVAPSDANDTTVMVELAETAITNGTDVLIGPFYSADIFGDVCKAAKEQGIYVVTTNCYMGEEYQDFWIGTEAAGMGVNQAKALVEQVGDAECSVVYMQTGATIETQNEQFAAFSDYLADYDNITVFGQQYCDSQEVVAAELISNLVKANPEINACVAADGNGCVGVANYIDEQGIKDDFYYVGIDAGTEVIQYMLSCVIDVTVMQDFETMGRECVMMTKSLMDGEEVAFANDSGAIFLYPDEAEQFAIDNDIAI